jgi:hypothetical protein
MDLALHLGMTAAGVSRGMSEREFVQWQHYADKRMLPLRRLELYLAQIALLVDRAWGGAKNKSLRDYLFDHTEEAPAAEDDEDAADFGDPEEIASFFGSQVYRKKG